MQTIKKQAGKSLRAYLGCLLLLALAGCTPPGPRALLDGKKLIERGNYDEAVGKLRTATALLSTNALAYSYLGVACQHAGQFAEAETAYRRALSLNRDMTEVHYNLGCLFLEQNKLEQAKAELTAFALRRSNLAEGWIKLGTVQLRSREAVVAEKTFTDALRLDPANAEALTGLGLARLQRGRAPEAAQCFAKALDKQPGYRPALLNLAIVAQEQLKDRGLALQKYRQYLALKPTPANAGAVKEIVRQLEQELNPVPRTATNEVASTPVPQVPGPRTSPGPSAPGFTATTTPSNSTQTAVITKTNATLTGLKSSPPASPITNAPKPAPVIVGVKPTFVTNLSKTVPSSPLRPIAATNSTTLPEEVVTLAEEPVFKPAQAVSTGTAPAQGSPAATAVPPTQPAARTPSTESAPAKRGFFQRINPANLFTRDEKTPIRPTPLPDSTASQPGEGTLVPPAARYSYRSPRKPTSGNRPEAERSFTQGLQAQQAQRLPEAIQAYRRAIQVDPGFYDAYYNLGLAASQSGNIEMALGSYEIALAIRPESLDARYNFALVLKQANFPLDAVAELEKILTTYPNESRTHLALGNLYAQQLQQPAKARPHYLKVLESDPRNPQAAPIRYWLTENPAKQ
jgi:tetratricopeptide (TPR) repeat protein